MVNDKIELTLLSKEEILGDSEGKQQLEVLKKYIKNTWRIFEKTDLIYLIGFQCCLIWTSSFSGDSEETVRCLANQGREFNNRSFNRNGIIRPALKLPPDIFKQIITHNKIIKKYGIKMVQFGYYPQYFASHMMQVLLNDKRDVIALQSGRNYTFDSISDYLFAEKFSPVTYPEYMYKGERYLLVQEKDAIGYNEFEDGYGDKISFNVGDSVWLKVSPVSWLIDYKTQTLISEKGLLTGIRFNSSKEYDGNFSKTEMKWYLDNYMIKDLFQDEPDFLKLIVNDSSSNQKTQENEKTEKIYAIVDEIEQLMSSHYGNQDIMEKVFSLIDKYNEDIKKAFNNQKESFILTTENVDKDYLYTRLIGDLSNILGEVKASSEKYQEYAKMLELIKKCLNVLESNNSQEIDDDLIKDIDTIKKVILPFLDDDDKEIKKIFLDEEENIISYLKGNENSPIKIYKNLEEFKLGLRKKLQPYLIKLNNAVRNKDLINEIKDGYLKLSTGLFEKSKDDYINYLLDDIQKNILKINNRGNEKEKKELKVILDKIPKFNDDLMKSLKEIINLYISIYKILLDVIERENNDLTFKDYTINVSRIRKK